MTTTLKQRFALLAERNPKISQAYLAKVTGAKPPSVNGWFSGASKSMKANTAAKVAAVYNVNPIWLATGEGSPEDQGSERATHEPNSRWPKTSTLPQNSAPVFDWLRIEEVLSQPNINFASEPHLPVPSGSPEICKWFTLSSDHPRLRLNRGNKVAINPEPDLSAYVDGQLCLFRTKAGAYILGDFRRLGDGFEAIPDSGLPLESERHHIQAVGIVKGTWFA